MDTRYTNGRMDSAEDAASEALIRELSRHRAVRAPASVLPVVLAGAGLADAYAPTDSPIGPVFVAYNREGISFVRLAGDHDAFESSFRSRFGRPARNLERLPRDLALAIERQLAGDVRAGLRLDLRELSEFERAVLSKAREVPRGEVRTYSWLAREIGRPRAARAVGAALGNNPIPLLVPCHRVIRSDGHLNGYVFGGEAKRRALEAEGADPDELERLARSGVRFVGSDTTRIYCFPTCRNARRISERHLVPFASALEAAASGYRPCRVCRPAV